MLTDKRVVSTDVAIQENKEKMKVLTELLCRVVIAQHSNGRQCACGAGPLPVMDGAYGLSNAACRPSKQAIALLLVAHLRLACQEMKAFWVPSKTPEAKALVEQPDMQTRCPASGKPLRFKDLIPVNFTKPPRDDGNATYAVDPVSNDGLTNSQRLVLLKPTGATY